MNERFSLLKGFIAHGCKDVGASGATQRVFRCVFCGKEKMYVGKFNGLWDCKSGCGSGSYFSFLKLLAKNFKLKKGDTNLKILAKNKGLPEDILLKYGVAFNKVTNDWLIPIYSDEKITDLKRYKFWADSKGEPHKYFISSPGTRKTPMLSHNFGFKENVVIVEGEWDFFTAIDVFSEAADIFCIPGATTYP